MLTTQLVTLEIELSAIEGSWNALADGQPMRSWNWLAMWWKHYSPVLDSQRLLSRELHVIAVIDLSRGPEHEIVGIAPWYIERTALESVIHPLGSGHVCTDHLSLLCRPEDGQAVAHAVAERLAADDSWDRLDLSAIDADDAVMGQLVAELKSSDCLVSQYAAGNCWVVDLPETWDDYLESLSASHRRQLRKCQIRYIDSGRAQRYVATTPREFERAWNIFVELHQSRRKSLGEPGCFASPQFHDFHHELAAKMLGEGKLRLAWTELDGEPFTAEYQLYGSHTIYNYQGGMDAARLDDSPGRLANLWTLRTAIEEGYRHFDFLRGDEPYKAHFRAEPQPIVDYRIFPNRRLARLRGRLMNTATTVKQWMKQSVELVTN